MKKFLILLMLFSWPATALEPAMDAGQLAHELDRLSTTTRVLYVAAHPDDENTRLLAYLAGEKHLEVAYLSMTRGGGGQNLIGGEQGVLLDVVRTEELLAARRIDGGQQRFTRMRDFGYSKRADETFDKWGKEEALADVVWVIRTFQPDVIITRFSEEPPNHGHHTASAILAREAFSAAADARRFPEQLRDGVTVWQADRLLQNIGSWPGSPPPPPGAIELDVGAYDPRSGQGYAEIAARSRSQHKSQGFGVPGERGPLVERFVPVAGRQPKLDLLEGLKNTWPAGYAKAIAAAQKTLERDQPKKALPALFDAADALGKLPDSPRVRDARRSLARVIAAAAGLYVRATARTPVGVPGDPVDVDVEVVLRSGVAGSLESIAIPGARVHSLLGALGKNEKKVTSLRPVLPPETPISTPYWLELPPEAGRYAVRDPRSVGAPVGAPALAARVVVKLGGRELELEVPVVHAWTDPVHGERVRDFLVVPPATVTPARDAVMLVNGKPGEVVVTVRPGKPGVRGEVKLELPAGWKSAPASVPVNLADETTVRFAVSGPRGAAVSVRPTIVVDGKAWSFRQDTIDHPHIPLQLVLAPASLKLVPLTITLPRGRVGYVHGPGDSVAEDLAHVGVQVEDVDDETLRSGSLDRYAAIVVGIRAYNTSATLRAAQPRLLKYVADGGTLVVQYQTNSRIGPLTVPIAPCGMEITRDRVTDENAAVAFVDARSPLLTRPNKIGAEDFVGWVQERGIYFAGKWDACLSPLFSMKDPGEEPLLGSTLVGQHGKGRFVYTGLVFFRQLPAGVPGAYRLMANLIGGK